MTSNVTNASSSFIVETDIETESHVDSNTETDMRILDEQPTEEDASQSANLTTEASNLMKLLKNQVKIM